MTDTTENTTPTPTEDDGTVEVQKKLVSFFLTLSDGSRSRLYAPEDHSIFGEDPLGGKGFYGFFDGDGETWNVNPAHIVTVTGLQATDKIWTYRVPEEPEESLTK